MLHTRLLKVSPENPNPASIAEAASVLRAGGLVAFPTETVYGLAADVFNQTAIRKIFDAKGRPSDNPLIVHIADFSSLAALAASFPPIAQTLTTLLWPGPLTLVVKRTNQVPECVSPGLDTVAVRMPNHPVALALIRGLGRGIVAPSANLSGRPSPTNAQHVLDDLDGEIDMILDSGPTQIGVESTVLDVTETPPAILRTGGITKERLEQIIGKVNAIPDGGLARRSPGTRHRHYSPRARVVLVEKGDAAGLSQIIGGKEFTEARIGCILHSINLVNQDPRVVVRRVSSSAEEISHTLYSNLRDLDMTGVDVIVVESIDTVGIGAAVMDRLRRAAQPKGED